MLKKLIIALFVIIATYQYLYHIPGINTSSIQEQTPSTHFQSDNIVHKTQRTLPANNPLHDAFANQRSGIQVQGEGSVIRLLKDDLSGSRHQRFILRLKSGQTVLVAHNIDLAPKINRLKKGDTVAFYGQYEWNTKGGIIHWTHHDPGKRHIDGWLKHNGRTYQ
jgi:molybdopterin converting factor small subunit